MCYPIGAKLAQPCILSLEKLYHHLFSTPGHDTTTIDQLKQDLVQWLTHHSFEELPDALEYYLADPNSDLEGNLAATTHGQTSLQRTDRSHTTNTSYIQPDITTMY